MKRIYAKIYNFYNIYGEKEGKATLTKYCIWDESLKEKTDMNRKPRRQYGKQLTLSHKAAALIRAL